MTLKRILVISPSCFPGTTGDSTNYLEMIRGLMHLGIQIVLVCPKHRDSDAFDEEMRKRGAKIIRIPVSPPRLAEVGERQIVLSTVLKLVMFYVVGLLTALTAVIENNSKHVIVRHCIHTLNLPPLLGVLGFTLKVKSVADGDLLSSFESLAVFRAPKFVMKILAFYERAVIRLYTRFLVLTPPQIGLLTRVGFPKSRIILKGLGIDIKGVPVHSLEDIPQNTFGYFGGLEKWQNISQLLRTWAKVVEQKANAKLFIIGDGSMKNDLKKLANDLQITESTFFFDGVPRETLWLEYFKMFRVVIIPRSAKFFPKELPMKLIEAFAAGKPVIVTRVPGIASMINEKDGVVFAEPDNEESLVLAICELADDDEKVFELSKLALNASQRFSLDSQLRRLVEVLAG
jgi:glycosyltransferase involved in cell wall biosynthesis